VATGPGGVGAAALAAGVAAAFSAGFPEAAGAAAGAALTLLAGVCAWTTDANEIIPATADNQKALLRRITTLSRRDLSIDTGGFQSPAPRLERRMEPQAPSGIFYCGSLPAKSDFHTSSRGCASWGRTPPRRMRVYNSATAGPRPLGTGGRACVSAVRPDPPARRSRRLARPGAGPAESLINAVSCGKHGPSATVGRPDRTADRTPPWDVLIGQRP